jgi:hypothetical protein
MGAHAPFGDSGFKAGVISSAVLVIAGLALTLLTRSDLQSASASFLALGILGLSTAGAGLLAERVGKRRLPTHWPEGQGGNGSAPDRDHSGA